MRKSLLNARLPLREWDWTDTRRKLSYVARALKITWAAASNWTASWGILLVLQGIIPALTVYLTKILVDAVAGAVGGGTDWENLAPLVYPGAAMAGVLLLGPMLQNAVAWIRSVQAEYVTDYIKKMIHDKTAAVDLEFYDIPEYFDHMSRANEEADRRVLSILENTGLVAQNLISLLAITGILFPYGWWVPVVLLGSTIPALAIVVIFQRIYHDWWRGTTEQRRWTRYYDRIITERESAQEVRLFDLSGKFSRLYQEVRSNLRSSHLRLLRNQRIASITTVALSLVATGAIMAWMIIRALRGTGTLGDVALFYQAFNQGQKLMHTLLGSAGVLYTDALFLEHLFTFLDLEPRVKTPARPAPVPRTLERGIKVSAVTFRYPGSEGIALKDLNLFIPAGKTVAIVGRNGAGKSTLIKLLCRFYDPEGGSVQWDGIDIRDFEPRALWRRATVLFQDPVNYAGSVQETIAYGDATASLSQERLERAVAAAGAQSVIRSLPKNGDTLLGKQFDSGVELSGGEWQRVALARAFYRDASVVLLDEPTSFMDSWAEMQWLDRFSELVRNRTAVIVTHRFTTAMRADLIYVVDAGRVIESGTHEELLAQDGAYARSWNKQMRAERSQVTIT